MTLKLVSLVPTSVLISRPHYQPPPTHLALEGTRSPSSAHFQQWDFHVFGQGPPARWPDSFAQLPHLCCGTVVPLATRGQNLRASLIYYTVTGSHWELDDIPARVTLNLKASELLCMSAGALSMSVSPTMSQAGYVAFDRTSCLAWSESRC